MAYVKIPQNPGVFKDDTSLAAEGSWTDSNYIRFVRNKAETRAGYEKAAIGQFLGICRGMKTWLDTTGLSYCGFGTHTNCYAFQDGIIYDISPVVSRGQVSVSFTTVIGSSTVTADWTAHGLVVGQSFSFDNATVATVGGVTIDTPAATAAAPSPAYIVVTVASANQITFVAAQTATSTAGPTASTVDYLVFLAPGLSDSLGGSGYGTGGFGSGAYGSSSATTLYARTWSPQNWAQNLLMSPRGGGLYEWSPLFTQTELVTNGDMSSATGWTQGVGWSIAAGTATATAGSGSDLSTVVTMTAAAWFVLEFDYTRSAGTLQPKIGSTSLGSALSAASAHVKLVFYTGTSPLIFTKDATFAGTVDNVSLKQLINLSIVTNAPTQNTCMVVTPEFICMLLGTADPTTGVFNPLQIRWSDQYGNPANTGVPLQTWTGATSNQAGDAVLSDGSRIVGAMNTPFGIAVWTDTALYIGRYSTDPNVIYRFDLVGTGCGLIGPNAAAVVGGAVYWMGNGGQFFVFSGAAPVPIESTCRRDVFDNLALVQQDKICAAPIAAFTEVQWLYPDSRDGNECSRYIKLNTMGNSSPCWDVGVIDRTAWIDQSNIGFPMATSAAGYLYYQEKGDSFDGGGLSWSLTQGAFDIGDGNTLFQISKLIPDIEDQRGNISLTVNGLLYPNATPVAYGPFTVSATSQTVDFILIGRQAANVWSGNTAPCFARFGAPRIDLTNTGMMF